ncbi:PHB depolymerase family esterase [Acidisphaera sp. L21]|uniref:extracellular catalytic domain type 1 short-chain-length polyhydroxyalkanoate depolymerase n=1 Tax=Acidisphaera sp. L21 TaxID=1641851 RepID=UPI00131D0968|nr:PHB depolymerase family esterase [Acidisphaera sp. L21]
MTLFANALREASRLTEAGRLMEATAAIQRMLAGNATAAATASAADDVGLTIQGSAKRVGEHQATHSFASRPSFLGKVSLKDLVRPKMHATSFSGSVPVPEGANSEWSNYVGPTGSRRYMVYVPSSHRTDVPSPLVVMLHGCTQSPGDFAAGTRMNEAAEAGNFLVAYPEQTSAANMQKCWNWFVDGDQRRGAGEPGVIAGITREIVTRYAIDPSRVYVAGLSAGGAMAAILGEAYPDLYAAIGVHSGLPCGAAHDMPSAFSAMRQGVPANVCGGQHAPIRAIVFHGDRDTTVNLRNAEAVVAQAIGGAALVTSSKSGTARGGHGYTRTECRDAAGHTVVEQWTIHGAPHAWAGGSVAGSYTDPRGPDATAEMVRFFLNSTAPVVH